MKTFKQFLEEDWIDIGMATAVGGVTALGALTDYLHARLQHKRERQAADKAIADHVRQQKALAAEKRKAARAKKKISEALIMEAPPPGEWGEWARRMVTADPKNATWAYGKAWKEHKAGTPPPKVRTKRQRNDKIGKSIKSPPKRKYQNALRTAKKQRKTNKPSTKRRKRSLQERLNFKRAALIGGATVGAAAATGALSGLGAVPGAAIGALYYGLSGELKRDLKKKPGDWNYNKKVKKETT